MRRTWCILCSLALTAVFWMPCPWTLCRASASSRGLHGTASIRSRRVGAGITLLDQWRSGGGVFSTVTAHEASSIRFFSGLARGRSWWRVARVAPSFRPLAPLSFLAATNDWPARLELLPSGELFWRSGGVGTWLSLSNCVFTVAPGRKLRLSRGFHVLRGRSVPAVLRDGSVCVAGGVLGAERWGEIARLPVDCRPPGRLVFAVSNGDWPARVDLLPDGRLLLVGGHGDRPELSLNGVCYSVHKGHVLPLAPGWRDLGRGYCRARFFWQKGIVLLGGVVKRLHGAGPLIAEIPRDYRPRKRLVFLVSSGHECARIDVTPDGRVVLKTPPGRNRWISLSGIQYAPEPEDLLPW